MGAGWGGGLRRAERTGRTGRSARAWLAIFGLALGTATPALAQTSAAADTLPFNEFDFGFTTLAYGMGLLVDFGTAVQDSASRAEANVETGWKLRDARVLLRGRFRG